MRSTDFHRLAQMRTRGGAGVRPGSMEFGSRRVFLHPNLPLLVSLFHLCESVRICGRDPLSSRRSRTLLNAGPRFIPRLPAEDRVEEARGELGR